MLFDRQTRTILTKVRNVLLRGGMFVSRTSRDSDVRNFLSSLIPYETDKTLIRIGGTGDGGYLIPDDLDGIDYCFSPGVDRTSKFENDLAARGIRSFLADYSVDGPAIESEMFSFEKKYLGAVNNDMFMTLQHWVGTSLPDYTGDLLLQMDIEGSEYDVIQATPPDVFKKFRIIIVEFHDLHNAFNQYSLRFLQVCLEKLMNDFEIVHIHPNNGAISGPLKRNDIEIPRLVEMTFLRKDRVRWKRKFTKFPHPLDTPNVLNSKDIIVPDSWYRN